MPSLMSVPGAVDVDLLVALDPLGQALGLRRGPLPGGERVGVVGQAGAEVEVLVVGSRLISASEA